MAQWTGSYDVVWETWMHYPEPNRGFGEIVSSIQQGINVGIWKQFYLKSYRNYSQCHT